MVTSWPALIDLNRVTHLKSTDNVDLYVDFMKLNITNEMQRRDQCCFKSGGNNYYKYLVVLSDYGCAGHILTSIVTRWAQLLSMQESERASEWDEDTVLSIGCGFQVLHSLSDFSISSVCVLTCKHPQRYKFVAHFGERAFSLKAVVCYENRRW